MGLRQSREMTELAASSGRLRPRFAALFDRYRFAVSALDQMGLSAFNFALNLCLVRVLSASDFGIVSLWIAMSGLAIGAQNALVNTPLSVYLPAATDPEQRRRLEQALGVVNLLTIALTVVMVVLVTASVEADWAPHDTIAFVAIPLSLAAGMYREYYRSIAFSRHDMAVLLLIDIPYVVATSLGLVAMLVWPHYFGTLAGAFLAMSVGCIASQLIVRRRLAPPRASPGPAGSLSAYRRILGEVTWSLIGVGATHLHTRGYVYVVVNLVGLAGLAAINVVGVLFRPVRTMLTAWGRSALPHIAGLAARGDGAGFDRAIGQAFGVSMLASVAWFVVLWLGWTPIEQHFLAGKYPGAWALMVPWAIAAALDSMEYTLGIALQAAREFRFLAYATMIGAPITAAATAGAIWFHGYTWTMYGVAFANAIAIGFELSRLYVVRRRLHAKPASPPAASA